MNTTLALDESKQHKNREESPGRELAQVREKKGYTREYVASKLHLRVRLIELLEEDAYTEMPQPVFIMGYLRAYAKLLAITPDPLIASFKNLYTLDQKPEKALWQSKRESNKGELVVRVLTALVAVSAMIAIAFWWQKSKEETPYMAEKTKESTKSVAVADLPLHNLIPESKLTRVSTMQSMFSSKSVNAVAEKADG